MSFHAFQMKRRIIAGKCIVGIDPAKAKHQMAVIDAQGVQIGESFLIKHSHEGFRMTLWEKLAQSGICPSPEKLYFAVETSCNLWQTLSYYLHQQGYRVLLVSPLTTFHSRSFINHDFSKTDPKDALMVANSAQNGYFDFYRTFSAAATALHRLAISYNKLKKNLVQNKTRLRAQIELVFPEFCQVVDPSTQTARFLLPNYFLPRHFQEMDIKKTAPEIYRISRHTYGQATLQKLATLAETSIGIPVDPLFETGVRQSIHSWIQQIEMVQNSMSALMAEMIALARQTPYYEILISLKGISDKLAALFIAETRDLGDFDDYRKLEKFAGLNLRQSQSGTYQGKRHISHIGNKRLSWIIYKMTEETAKYVPEVRCKFLRRQLKEKKYRKNVIACSSVLLKLIVALVKQNRRYEPAIDSIKAVAQLEQQYNEKYARRPQVVAAA